MTAVAEPMIGEATAEVPRVRAGGQMRQAWRRLCRNPLSRIGALMIAA